MSSRRKWTPWGKDPGLILVFESLASPSLLLDLLCTSSISWKQITLEFRLSKSFLWVRNWRRVILLFFSLRSLNHIQDFSQGCSHLKAQLGLEDPLPRCLTHMAGKLEVVVSKRLSYFIIHARLSLGCLSILIIWIPLMNDEESAKRKDNIFYVLILELILHDFHYILLTISVSPIPCEEGAIQGHGSHDSRITPGPKWRLITMSN